MGYHRWIDCCTLRSMSSEPKLKLHPTELLRSLENHYAELLMEDAAIEKLSLLWHQIKLLRQELGLQMDHDS